MAEPKIILYVDSTFASPYAMSSYVALCEKNLAFEVKTLNLEKNEHLATAYSNLSLTRRVPTLIHDNFRLSESSAISEYLEEAFPAPQYPQIYPSEIRDRARAREIQAWLRSDFIPIREQRSTAVIFFKPSDKALTTEALRSAEKLFHAADRLIGNDRENIFGDWCIADADLALMLNRLVMNGDDVPEKLLAYANHQWQRNSIQRWMGQPRSI